MAFESDGYLVTDTRTSGFEATEIDLTVTVPTDTQIDVTVYQDTSGGTTADNTETLADVSSGTTPLSNFEAASGATYWLRFDLSTSDSSVTPEVDAATVTVQEVQTLAASALEWEFGQPTAQIGFQIAGTVTLSGSGVSGARVFVVDADANELEVETATDANGEYSVTVPNGTTYHVTVQYDDGSTLYNALSKPFIES